MTSEPIREAPATPEDIPRLFLRCVERGDFAGIADLYEDVSVLALPPGRQTRGSAAIAEVFRERFGGGQQAGSGFKVQPALVCGDLALTSSRLPDGRVTAEVARRQPDGSWRWVIDQPQL